MTLILDNKLAPITSEIGFLETDFDIAVQEFTNWSESIEQELGRKVSIVNRPVLGNLEQALLELLPLTSHEIRRHLFVPTIGSWVAYFNNSKLGTDTSSFTWLATKIGCRALTVAAVPDITSYTGSMAFDKFQILEIALYGPDIVDSKNCLRLIRLTHDIDKWEFHTVGYPFPFEDTQRYESKRIKDRFDFDLLRTYLKALGLSAFEDDFYLPITTKAIIVEKIGTANSNMKEYTLNDIRAKLGI